MFQAERVSWDSVPRRTNRADIVAFLPAIRQGSVRHLRCTLHLSWMTAYVSIYPSRPQKLHKKLHAAPNKPNPDESADKTAAVGSLDITTPQGNGSSADVVLKEGQYIPNPKFNYTGSLRPIYPLSEKRAVPAHIPRPDYADHGTRDHW
jgi:hypothetical protein